MRGASAARGAIGALALALSASLLAPASNAVEALDGRVEVHGYYEAQIRSIVRDFDWGKTRRLASGRVLREWELVAVDKEFQVAPGVSYAGWAYNGRIPGPTLRARTGARH